MRASAPRCRRIQAALEQHARVLVMSHLGRPEEGKFDEEFSLAPVAKRLSQLLGVPVPCKRTGSAASSARRAKWCCCENVRFNKGEKKDDEELCAQNGGALRRLRDGRLRHRAPRRGAAPTASRKFAPVACAGPLLVDELTALETALEKPARPLLAIVGGSKVSTKLTVLESLLEKVDQLIVGGGIANTFLAARGFNVGKSLYEPDMLDICRRSDRSSRQKRGIDIPMPTDVVVAQGVLGQGGGRRQAGAATWPPTR